MLEWSTAKLFLPILFWLFDVRSSRFFWLLRPESIASGIVPTSRDVSIALLDKPPTLALLLVSCVPAVSGYYYIDYSWPIGLLLGTLYFYLIEAVGCMRRLTDFASRCLACSRSSVVSLGRVSGLGTSCWASSVTVWLIPWLILLIFLVTGALGFSTDCCCYLPTTFSIFSTTFSTFLVS